VQDPDRISRAWRVIRTREVDRSAFVDILVRSSRDWQPIHGAGIFSPALGRRESAGEPTLRRDAEPGSYDVGELNRGT
jgi:hypothetical protein